MLIERPWEGRKCYRCGSTEITKSGDHWTCDNCELDGGIALKAQGQNHE